MADVKIAIYGYSYGSATGRPNVTNKQLEDIQLTLLMKILAAVFVGLVAAEHIYILWLEMFAWTTRGPKAFRKFPKELFAQTTALAANQGLYNGFLSAGLIWSLLITDPAWSLNVACFFLGCVIVAGIYGGFTASKSIFWVQAAPAAIALGLTLLK